MVKNRLDFSGTGVLDGAATPAEIIASQKLNFIELGGFSQHFAAAYVCKLKRGESIAMLDSPTT